VIKLHARKWLLPLLAALALGCDPPGRPNPADRPVPADQVKDFGTLYAMRCAGCHGADGKLGPAPPLNDPLFLAIVPDETLSRIITEGRAVTPTRKSPMPAFGLGKSASLTEVQVKEWAELRKEADADPRQHGVLTEAQIKVLAEGIKKRWQVAALEGSDVPPYLAPPGSGNKEEGKRVFARACAGCHGSQGQRGKLGERQIGAINNPAFLALISDQALRRYAITGRPDLGMPPFNGPAGRPSDFRPLTSAEIHDLVALLAYWRLGGPADGK
jgi:cytochrome c oxidase cbb3-type subunit III